MLMGNAIDNYELCIIQNDNDFILKISSLISMRIRPMVDCIFLSPQKEASRVPIFLAWEIEADAKGIKIPDE